MARLLKSRELKRGASPGTLVHIGERRSADTATTLMTYDPRSFSEQEVDFGKACVPLKGNTGVSWLNVEGVTQDEVLKRI